MTTFCFIYIALVLVLVLVSIFPIVSPTNVAFVPWPHRRIFDGFLGFGGWSAGDRSVLNMMEHMPNFTALDNIQRSAISYGVFLVYRSNSSSSMPTYMPFHLFSAEEALQCLSGKTIYLLGDSYMMQMYIGLRDVLTNSPSNKEFHEGASRHWFFGLAREQLANLNRTKIRFLLYDCVHGDLQCFMRGFADKPQWKKEADAIVANVLVHHLDLHPHKEKAYMGLLRSFMTSLSGKITWASGPAYDINKIPKQYLNATLERPADYLNQQSFLLTRNLSIPMLDFYTLTGTCHYSNCTIDGGHRSRFVNRMKVQMLLNNLCEITD